MKIQSNKSKRVRYCPVCGLPASKPHGRQNAKLAPFGYRLRQHLKRHRPRNPAERNWRTDPLPGDYIAILDRACYEKPNPDDDVKVPLFRHVVRVSEGRVYYRLSDTAPVHSCSLSTWGRLDADLVGAAVTRSEPKPN
jgi:hypothetical protein